MRAITDDDYAKLMELARVAQDLTQSQRVYDAARDLLSRHQCPAAIEPIYIDGVGLRWPTSESAT